MSLAIWVHSVTRHPTQVNTTHLNPSQRSVKITVSPKIGIKYKAPDKTYSTIPVARAVLLGCMSDLSLSSLCLTDGTGGDE